MDIVFKTDASAVGLTSIGFGVIECVTETHSTQGPKASKPFTFTMIVDSICLIEASGVLMSDITPLGGVSDGSTYS